MDEASTWTLTGIDSEGMEEITIEATRYQIAQKIHACSEPATEAQPNDRTRDLVDLGLMEELSVTGADLAGIKAACREIITSPRPARLAAAHRSWSDLESALGPARRRRATRGDA